LSTVCASKKIENRLIFGENIENDKVGRFGGHSIYLYIYGDYVIFGPHGLIEATSGDDRAT